MDDRGEDVWDEEELRRWPLDWRGLLPHERWIWFERLWGDVCLLRDRYRLPLRSRWWEDPIQVEALAALSAWTARYDSGEWDDPPGNLPASHRPTLAELFGTFSVEVKTEAVRTDFVGRRFGSLVVTEHIGWIGRHRMVLTRCDCGRTHRTTMRALSVGSAASCDCHAWTA